MAGIKQRLIILLVAMLVGLLIKNYRLYLGPLPAPKIDVNRYWGPGNSKQDDIRIQSFKVDFSNEALLKLKNHLDASYLPLPLENSAFEYGFNSNRLKSIVQYWRDSYLNKFDERLAYMNQFPQFTTQIQGLNIHYVHIVPSETEGKTVLPLLLLHGWPGSFLEFYELIPQLIDVEDSSDIVFEVIIPSLPGYGFSQAAAKQGMGPAQMGIIMRNLMVKLGKEKFYVQGGDWGSAIGKCMATYFPEHVLGFHCNWCMIITPMSFVKNVIAEFIPSLFVDKEYQDWYFPNSKTIGFLVKESGYFHIQATKPDTIGTALAYSPVGLAAYILEKFSTWTNANYRERDDGGFEQDFSLDHLLDNIMVYYMSNSITSSVRLYKEMLLDPQTKVDRVPTSVPTGCMRSRYEGSHQIDWVLKDKYTNLIHSTHHNQGGHFAAKQLPTQLYNDFIKFIRKAEAFHSNPKA